MRQVVVLNASYEPLAVVSLHRAMTLVARERAVVVDAVPGETVKASTIEFPMPRVVQFREMVRVPYRFRTRPWTRHGVLQRDAHTCAYCGGSAATIDHILPSSRGGENSWLNTVAACLVCNNRKADRTPAEAGMPLRFQPREVSNRDSLLIAIAQTGVDVEALGIA